MTATVSLIIPVKDGARYLPELLSAARAQRIDTEVEIIVVDSGSTDGSTGIAAAAGAHVIEIAPAQFGHGRTRNRAAEVAKGEYLVFLTQDATPANEHWLAHLTGALDAEPGIGLAFGPHLPRPGTSPMVARELEEFFNSFSPAGEVRVDAEVDPAIPASGFFSNVNSCIRRSCWEQVRFRDVAYSEDQAFARDALAAGWKKAYAPAAGVLHAHDYPFRHFMRRYFDEYRGLRETVGHVEPAGLRRLATTARRQVAADLAYMRDTGAGRARRLGWTGRSTRHHLGRGVFSALGSRAERLPASVARRISLERRSGEREGRPVVTARGTTPYDYVRAFRPDRAAPLAAPSPHDGEKSLLHIAWLIPPFRRGSGGHMTLFTIARALEERGHSCSIWIHDPTGMMDRRVALAHREIEEHFAPLHAGVFRGFEDWQGADVALATGWQTAYPLWTLPGCKLKAYFVQDYEPDFFPASAERLWAEATYRMGYPCIAASPWLRDLVRGRFGAPAEPFELGVDFDLYRPLELERDSETVVFYARPATPRRATEMGILALAELRERLPGTRVVMFGDVTAPAAPFEYEFGGVMDPAALARLYNEATVGLVISLTNYSRMPKEMMACGLPVVDVRHPSVVSVFGADGDVVALAEADVASISARIESLLDDPAGREAIGRRARSFVSGMTWDAAAEQVERALRKWLGERWRPSAPAPVSVTRSDDDAVARLRAHLT